MKLNKSFTKPTASEQSKHTVSFHVTNCSAKDAQFITCVIKLFCDPAFETIASELRNGRLALEYKPDTGEAFAFDLKQTIKSSCSHGQN